MKPFTTYEQQIELLKSRNLIINNENTAKLFLEKEGYFNVINGYKDVYLQDRLNEKYKANTKFEDISDLYEYDKKLRHKMLILILNIENTFKSIIAYEFAQQFGAEAYLNTNNFSTKNPDIQLKVSKFILNLKNEINNNVKNKGKQYDCLRHYQSNHTFIPIWVLFKYLTFGQISIFYSILQSSTRNAIAKHISDVYQFELNDSNLYAIIRILATLRNMCAHNQRLYDFTTNFSLSDKNATIKKIKLKYENSLHNINLFFLLFYIFAPKTEFLEFTLFHLSNISKKVLFEINIDLNYIRLLINEV